MRFTFSKKDYVIEFEYKGQNKFITECRILEGKRHSHPKDMREVTSGEAIRVKADVHIKEVGRKVALTRALRNVFSEKEHKDFRRAVWTAYLNRH